MMNKRRKRNSAFYYQPTTDHETDEYAKLVRLGNEFEAMCSDYETVGDLIEVYKLYNSLSIIF